MQSHLSNLRGQPRLTKQGLDLVNEYIEQIKSGNISQGSSLLSQEDKDFIPATRNLFSYAKTSLNEEIGQDRVKLFSDWYESTGYSYNETRHVVANNLPEIENLITICEQKLKDQERHSLFSKKLAEMSGYEFERYLKELKILK